MRNVRIVCVGLVKVPNLIEVNEALVGREFANIRIAVGYGRLVPGVDVGQALCKILFCFEPGIFFAADAVLTERAETEVAFVIDLIELLAGFFAVKNDRVFQFVLVDQGFCCVCDRPDQMNLNLLRAFVSIKAFNDPVICLILELIDLGIEEEYDIDEEENEVTLYGDPKSYAAIQKWFEENGYEVKAAEFTRIPNDLKDVTPEQRETIDKIVERLDEDDDVQNVYTNMKPLEEE